MIQILKIAGLVHDIGHGMFSHLFDHHFADKLGIPHHEKRGVNLFRQMVNKYSIQLSDEEVDLICGVIVGKFETPLIIKDIGGFSGPVPPWITQIVNNQKFELDTDKIDYLLRDAHYTRKEISIRFEMNAVFDNCKIDLDTGDIVFNADVYEEINAIFTARHRLHKLVYQNPKTIAVQLMVIDYLNLLLELPSLQRLIASSSDGWTVFTDDVLSWFNNPLIDVSPAGTATDGESKGAVREAELLKSVSQRCREIKYNLDTGRIPRLVKRSMVKTGSPMKTDIVSDARFVQVPVSINFSSKTFNPMDSIIFYDDEGAHTIRPDDVSKLVKSDVKENWIYTFRRGATAPLDPPPLDVSVKSQ